MGGLNKQKHIIFTCLFADPILIHTPISRLWLISNLYSRLLYLLLEVRQFSEGFFLSDLNVRPSTFIDMNIIRDAPLFCYCHASFYSIHLIPVERKCGSSFHLIGEHIFFIPIKWDSKMYLVNVGVGIINIGFVQKDSIFCLKGF